MAKYNISSIIKEKLKEKEEGKKEPKNKNQEATENNTSKPKDKIQNTENNTTLESENDNKVNNNQLMQETTTEKSNSKEEEHNNEISSIDIIEELKKIENNYLQNDYIDAPDQLELSTIEVPNKTEEDLISSAKQSLESKYSKLKTTTNENFEKQIEKILASNNKYNKSAEEKSEAINKIYSDSINETENQALKRGLARSSIIIGELSNLEASKANELSSILKELDNNLTNNEKEIANLEKEKDLALSNLDIEYAIELDEKINDLTEDYNKAKQDAIEFNNNVHKLQAEYKLDLEKQKQNKQKQLTELESKYGIEYTKDLIANEQFYYLKNYFSTLDKNKAISMFLTNKEFKNILGDKYADMYKFLKSM